MISKYDFHDRKKKKGKNKKIKIKIKMKIKTKIKKLRKKNIQIRKCEKIFKIIY